MKYYDLNTNSPYYQYMLDNEAEKQLTTKEKENILYSVRCALVFTEWESEPIPDDQRNFLIYSALNNMPDYQVFCILAQNTLPKKVIKKYDLLKKWK